MECAKDIIHRKCAFCILYLTSAISFLLYEDAMAVQTISAHSSSESTVVLSDPPTALFQPIEISPAVIPHNPYSGELLPPMYPSFPTTYEPVLTGKCPVNFSSLSSILDKTASDCSFAALVGNVICCPQVNSLLHIFQGGYNTGLGPLALSKAAAKDCFSDIISILTSRGANSTFSSLCMIKPSNLTGGSCPVKDVATFEKMVNTTKLVESCSTIDLKECCRPVCQPAIMDAAFRLSSGSSNLFGSPVIGQNANTIDTLSDCKGVVYAWLSRKLPVDDANRAFRALSSCKVNKVCPLVFKEPKEVVKACSGLGTTNPTCCSSLNSYISKIQKQMLITNKQAINCAVSFGSMLQKGGVVANVYNFCHVDLKDFSLQAYGQQGCLLRSLPSDVVFDNQTGFSFTCDLSDNIAAPWPSSSSAASLSLCAPEMSLPAWPSQISGFSGNLDSRNRYSLSILWALIFSLLQLNSARW